MVCVCECGVCVVYMWGVMYVCVMFVVWCVCGVMYLCMMCVVWCVCVHARSSARVRALVSTRNETFLFSALVLANAHQDTNLPQDKAPR